MRRVLLLVSVLAVLGSSCASPINEVDAPPTAPSVVPPATQPGSPSAGLSESTPAEEVDDRLDHVLDDGAVAVDVDADDPIDESPIPSLPDEPPVTDEEPVKGPIYPDTTKVVPPPRD